jgi:hypothetical protein
MADDQRGTSHVVVERRLEAVPGTSYENRTAQC